MTQVVDAKDPRSARAFCWCGSESASGDRSAVGLIPGHADTIVYQHTDALGSPVAETDASGTVVKRERMTAYGEPADGGWENGPGYTGHQMDAATKLVYMQQRYYDPAIGRFLSVDPVTTDPNTGASFNRYWYANNNPYKFIDPDGRDSFLASRPLKASDAASHNYVVVNAQYVGDPRATVYSYGNRGDGMTGRVTEKTKGPSEGTYEADKEHWAGLSLDLAGKSATKIDAPDQVVAEVAESVVENTEYSYVPALTSNGTNSNSAASAVANEAAGKKVPVPDGNRVSPGADQSDRIEIKRPEVKKP